jgi:hypothetical protein
MNGREKLSGILRPGLGKNAHGVTWVDLEYDEKLRRAMRPETLPNQPTVNRSELDAFMKTRIADLTRQGVVKNPAYADEKAAREHFPGRSIPRAWIMEMRRDHGAPVAWSKRGRKSNGN